MLALSRHFTPAAASAHKCLVTAPRLLKRILRMCSGLVKRVESEVLWLGFSISQLLPQARHAYVQLEWIVTRWDAGDEQL